MKTTAFHSGVHVKFEDIYDARDGCPVCLSKGPRKPLYRVQVSPVVEMLSCETCRACSASYMPKPELLHRYYAQYYSRSTAHYAFNDADRFARHVSAKIQLQPTRALHILDFGGGDGSLAVALAQQIQQQASSNIPVEIDVVDYERARDPNLSGVIVRGYRDINDIDGQYEVILASAILEHIPDVHSVIRKLVGMVSPGGFMYARTPYILPLARLIPNLDITYPAHVHDMGSEFWNKFIPTFNLRAQLISSRPSLVETTIRNSPIRTMLAHVLKAPARAEQWLLGQQRSPSWKFVGGWEAVFRFQ
jgi:2-polyprenyl-3-methyl-5-hydroxy-6-metoxy-1,4-benzoquinol methylase